MALNTRIKWIIDAENSEIIFRTRYVALGGWDGRTGARNRRTGYFYRPEPEQAESEFAGEREGRRGSGSMLQVTSWDCSSPVNYNLVIFDDKNPLEFWRRKTLAGLLLLDHSTKKILLTLHRTLVSFDHFGRASASFSVSGGIKIDQEARGYGIEKQERIVLDATLIFEGAIRLLQEY